MNSTAADYLLDRTPDSTRFVRFAVEMARNSKSVIGAIRAGFSSSLIDDASAFFDVPPSRICAIIHLPDNAQGTRLDAAASERLWRLATVYGMARDLFGDDELARAWLRKSNLTFGGDAPMDWLDTEPGGTAVLQVIHAIVTGGVL